MHARGRAGTHARRIYGQSHMLTYGFAHSLSLPLSLPLSLSISLSLSLSLSPSVPPLSHTQAQLHARARTHTYTHERMHTQKKITIRASTHGCAPRTPHMHTHPSHTHARKRTVLHTLTKWQTAFLAHATNFKQVSGHLVVMRLRGGKRASMAGRGPCMFSSRNACASV